VKQIESYVDEVYHSVGGNKKEIEELKAEMKSHLIEAVHELISEGKSEKEAIHIAIERFGDEKFISNGLIDLFKYQKKFTTNLFRFTLLSIIISVISFFSVLYLQDAYQSSLINMTQGILDTVNNKETISSNEIEIIENHIAKFENKYDSLSYLGVFYDDVQHGDIHNSSEAQYVYSENETINIEKINYGIGLNNWFVEAQLEDQYRDYFYIIPYSFLIISLVLFLVWLVSKMYNRKHRLNFRGENKNV